ncbi:S9 family peptidase [Clostridiaceae bacterium M8S5]|nr:S9 family peptidase [Clostridiaceae bacterium M8S5]
MKENIKINDICRFKYLSNVKLDGKGNTYYLLHEADEKENIYKTNLWIYNKSKEKQKKLTECDKVVDFIVLDDDSILYKSSKKNEKADSTLYYIMDSFKNIKELCIGKKSNKIQQINKNMYVFSATYNKNKEGKEAKNKEYEIFDEIPFWTNGVGGTNKNRNRLYIYDVNTNKYDAITDEYMNVESFNISEDRKKLIFIGISYENKMEIANHIYIYDIDEKTIERISRDERFQYSYANYISKDKIIYTGSDMKKYGNNENHKFYLIDINTQQLKELTPNFDCSLWNTVGSDCRYKASSTMKIDNGCLYFITTEGGSSLLNSIDIAGNIEKVIRTEGSVDSYDVKDGKVMFIGMRDNKLQELYELCKEKQITQFNNWVESDRHIVQLEKIKVKNIDDVEIDGWIMKPCDFDKDKKYPAILNIHGGPKTAYGDVFYHEMQYWAGLGYVVFFCNPRGSNGKDNEFSNIRGKFGTIDYEDIMKFTDEVLNKYEFIDKERVGVTGGSYGGYMTNWIIGHTDRFKAAVSQRCISNWISKFNTTDIGYYWVEDQNLATPWSDFEKLWDSSPLKYADKVKTPTLFIHADKDYRCFYGEGLQMFTALKYHNVEAKMCLFKGENHELSRSGKPQQRIARLEEITKWFDYYLKGQI